MSAANAAARKRRAGGASIEPAPQVKGPPPRPSVIPINAQQTPQPGSGLTLQQVISLTDSRLVKLETFMKETQAAAAEKLKTPPVQIQPTVPTQTPSASSDDINELADEFNERFDMLAVEIANLKDIVLKLQSYTMEVNKTLMEERINVLSDVNMPSESMTFNIGNENIDLEIVEE